MKRKDHGKHNSHKVPAPRSPMAFNVGGQIPGTTPHPWAGMSQSIDPIIAQSLVADGHRFTEKGQFADAEICFRKAIQINPNLPLAHNNLGFARQQQGDVEGSIAHYRVALELDPLLRLALGNLTKALVLCRRFDEALAVIEQRLALAPSEAQALDIAVDIALEAGRVQLASEYAMRHAIVRRASRWFPQLRSHDPRTMPSPAPQLTLAKLRHDIEQFSYLQQRGILGPEFAHVIASYQRILADLIPFGEDGRFPLTSADEREIGEVWARLVHMRPTPRVTRALSDQWDPSALEQKYLQEPPGIVFADNFLTKEALESLRAFCLESTIWSINRYTNGYLGAFFREGFNCPLLLQIAEELKQALPRLIGDRPLLHTWGYKYDSQMGGIVTHADFAAVNVNFWITPDEANLDPTGGGLTIYNIEAPINWDFSTYNEDRFTMQAFIKQKRARSVNIPHRQNRVVIFNSDLFHETSPFKFQTGYENRRINITMLYGTRERPGSRQ